VAQLHSLLKPFLLRRVKEDVEKSLPPKEETIIEANIKYTTFCLLSARHLLVFPHAEP